MIRKGESALHVAVVVGTLKAFRNRGLEVGHDSCSCIICTVGVWRKVGRSLDESGAAVGAAAVAVGKAAEVPWVCRGVAASLGT